MGEPSRAGHTKNDHGEDDSYEHLYDVMLDSSTREDSSVAYPPSDFETPTLSRRHIIHYMDSYSNNDTETTHAGFTGIPYVNPLSMHYRADAWNDEGQLAPQILPSQAYGADEYPIPSSTEALLHRGGPLVEYHEQGDSLQPLPPPRRRHASRRAPSDGEASPDDGGTVDTERTSYQCLYSGCNTKPFRRPADLDRHWRHTHANSTLEQFVCDYKKCVRHKEPFTRRDHCRDHYRAYHNEDILRRGTGSMPQTPSVSQKWWRCTKCLGRVDIANDEWQCPQCSLFCEPERRGLRGY